MKGWVNGVRAGDFSDMVTFNEDLNDRPVIL